MLLNLSIVFLILMTIFSTARSYIWFLFKPSRHFYSLSSLVTLQNYFFFQYFKYSLFFIWSCQYLHCVWFWVPFFFCWCYSCYLVSTYILWIFLVYIWVCITWNFILGDILSQFWAVFLQRISVLASGKLPSRQPTEIHLRHLTWEFCLLLTGYMNSDPWIVWESASG